MKLKTKEQFGVALINCMYGVNLALKERVQISLEVL